MFSTVMSAFFSIALTSSSPRGDFRLMASDFLLALNMWKYHGSSSGFPGRSRRPGSPVFGFSILTTSAPSQASASVQDVPASNWVKSTTRMPARHSRSWQLSLIADPLPRSSTLKPLPCHFIIARSRQPRPRKRQSHEGQHALGRHLDCDSGARGRRRLQQPHAADDPAGQYRWQPAARAHFERLRRPPAGNRRRVRRPTQHRSGARAGL